jgi:hypothetical protein
MKDKSLKEMLLKEMFLIALVLGGVACARPAAAQEVLAGFDVWETMPGTFDDLGGTNLALLCGGNWKIINPADGIIALKGVPLVSSDCCPDAATLTTGDTMVERLEDTVGLETGPDEVPIQICDLHLTSVNAFTVQDTVTLETEEWTLEVTLDPNTTQPVGQMTITRADATGGTFVTDELRVIPHLTFTRVKDNMVVCETDAPQIGFSSNPVNWVYTSPPNKLAVPGCTSNFFSTDDFSEEALLAAHFNTEPPCSCEVRFVAQVPVDEETWKWLFVAHTDCDTTNDFHLLLLEPNQAEIISCSVDPLSSWSCDVTPRTADWFTGQFGNPAPPCQDLPLFDIVIRFEGQVGNQLPLAFVEFTHNGVTRCELKPLAFPKCDLPPVGVEESSWGVIKGKFKN